MEGCRHSAPFVENDSNIRILDGIGQRYHVRPSELVCIDDPAVALDFDAAVLFRGVSLEKKEDEPSKEEVKKQQTLGFETIRALQNQAIKSYQRE